MRGLPAGRDRAWTVPPRDRARPGRDRRRGQGTLRGRHVACRGPARARRSPPASRPHPLPEAVIEIGAPDAGPREVAVGAARELPETAPVLPLRDTVTFPDMFIPLNVGQERSIELINDSLRGDRSLVMAASRNAELETPGPDDLYSVGVLGVIARMIRVPDGTLRVLIQGSQRVEIERWVQTEPYLVAEISERPDVVRQSPELTALV